MALLEKTVAGNKIIRIRTVSTPGEGDLSFFEAGRDFGFHAHKELRQMLFCPYGEIRLTLDDGSVREEITLNDPAVGVLIEKPTWREMLWLKEDSVLCVAASEYYREDDYIRNYEEFCEYVHKSERGEENGACKKE